MSVKPAMDAREVDVGKEIGDVGVRNGVAGLRLSEDVPAFDLQGGVEVLRGPSCCALLDAPCADAPRETANPPVDFTSACRILNLVGLRSC